MRSESDYEWLVRRDVGESSHGVSRNFESTFWTRRKRQEVPESPRLLTFQLRQNWEHY